MVAERSVYFKTLYLYKIIKSEVKMLILVK